MKTPVILNNYNDCVEQLAKNCDILIGAAQAKDPDVIREAFANVDRLTKMAYKTSLVHRKRVV